MGAMATQIAAANNLKCPHTARWKSSLSSGFGGEERSPGMLAEGGGESRSSGVLGGRDEVIWGKEGESSSSGVLEGRGEVIWGRE